ncbi:MAG: hypothetical protein UU13_C0004G0022 [Candidatus Nomurabacteria bacterium GW2011_GWB1_40_7]|uniref:Isoprenylcysteine carboxyl methyltransferase n=1 Tax=Candidatus Nomurabacteria bacterium GW2011_GWB1_40_7 TaxID=1618744 RepID=A0A0G0T6Y3_9BACT|nr:MAG: hypothetical protein UU13_C0004G0022 [Candidatus Nomurabacteria bacterium GW2011_GWB1_40_7]
MKTENQNFQKHRVHETLAHSYSLCFALFLAGAGLDIAFNFKVSDSFLMAPIGVFFLIFGTFLILWAQKTSRNLKKENISKETFYHGPYKYTRGPTHWGIFFLIIGFGMIVNTLFIILSALVSLLVSKFTFLDKQEKLLEEKYGAPYREYKKTVKF